MAQTPQTNQAFLREVDDELRRDQAAQLWRRYGRIALVAVALLLVALGGYLFWQHRQTQAAEREGEQLQAAYDAMAAQDEKSAAAPLAQLAASRRDGYRVLALFTQADALLQKDDLKGAAAIFAKVAGDASLAQPFRDLALIRQTTAEFDALKPEVVVQRMRPLAAAGNPWLGSAGELLAVAYLKQGRRDLAGQTFARIAADEDAPRSLRQRSVQMAGVLGVEASAGAAGKGVTKR